MVQNGGLGVCRAFVTVPQGVVGDRLPWGGERQGGGGVQGKRGSFMSVMVHSVHNSIVLHIGTPCCLF